MIVLFGLVQIFQIPGLNKFANLEQIVDRFFYLWLIQSSQI